MRKILMGLIVALMTMAGLTAVQAPVHANSSAEMTNVKKVDQAKKKVKKKCIKSQGATESNGVLSSKICFSLDLLKENECLARAVKHEQPAPPRDPKSVCKGKMKVVFDAKLSTTPCPPGYWGPQGELRLRFRQLTKVYAMAQSIASGNSWTLAYTYIMIKDKVKGWLKSDCVKIPDEPPPPVDTPTYSCDMLSVNKGSGRSVTIAGFSTSQSGGATFKEAVIEWGDGSSNTYAAPVGKSHTYGADGTYTIRATAVFVVDGVEKRVTSSGCQAAVTFTPPPQVNHAPQVELTAPPAHVEAGKNVALFGCARDEDGDDLTLPTPTVSPSSLGYVGGWRRLGAGESHPCQAGWIALSGTFWSNPQPGWACDQQQDAVVTMTGTDPDGLSDSDSVTIGVRKVCHPET